MSHPAPVLGLWVSLRRFAASVSLLAREWRGWRGCPTDSHMHVGQAGGRLGVTHSLGSFGVLVTLYFPNYLCDF